MEYLLVCATALAASGLTLFSGFGLGTLLLPAFALYFPITAAVAMTGMVHFANNLFKLVLLGRHADRETVLRFGLPAMAAAWLGARALLLVSGLPPLARYELAGRALSVEPVKLVAALLIAAFALLEILPSYSRLSFDRKYLPAGGLLSGFFGGLSGHQGALRSAFLVRAGLSKEAFIASGVAIACLVDASRLAVYGLHLEEVRRGAAAPLLAAATASAFLGAWAASRLVAKVSLRAVQGLVAAMLMLFALGLGSGLL